MFDCVQRENNRTYTLICTRNIHKYTQRYLVSIRVTRHAEIIRKWNRSHKSRIAHNNNLYFSHNTHVYMELDPTNPKYRYGC